MKMVVVDFLLGIVGTLVNTYVSYKEYMHSIGKQPMSHYEF